MGRKGKSNLNKRTVMRYVIHHARIASWVEDYDSGVRLEGLNVASKEVSRMKDFWAAEFPLKTIPHSEFEYRPAGEWCSLRIPLRKYICLASERVAMITGFSRMLYLSSHDPIPEDFTAPVCVIDAVTEALTRALSCELSEAQADRRYPDGDKLNKIISLAIDSAFNNAICKAVDTLDGITPDCNRELILFSLRGREQTGPPDPFSSKSRFRNDLMEALIWWSLPKKRGRKDASLVTIGNLTEYFSLIGYMDEPAGDRTIDVSECAGRSGGNERSVRRWLRRYSPDDSDWLTLRSSYIKIIGLTGYHLT